MYDWLAEYYSPLNVDYGIGIVDMVSNNLHHTIIIALIILSETGFIRCSTAWYKLRYKSLENPPHTHEFVTFHILSYINTAQELIRK